MNENILDVQQLETADLRRRDLLPIWIKIFVWIFLFFGAIVPIVVIFGIFGMKLNLSLYGLDTIEPISLLGMFITLLFALKAVVAFGLWTEKKWAVNWAIIDAIIGIIVCVLVMGILPFVGTGLSFSLRLELIALIPYLIKMIKINPEWIIRNELKNLNGVKSGSVPLNEI